MAPQTRPADAEQIDVAESPRGAQPQPTQAQIEATHASTGWSAYDVWRSRVLAPAPLGYNGKHGNS